MMEELLDPVALDRSIERAARAWRAWRRALFSDPESVAEQDPFGPPELRRITTKSAYDALAPNEKYPNPFHAGVRRWIPFLLQARLTREIDVELARALHAEETPSPFDGKRRVSHLRAWRGVIDERARGRAEGWFATAGERGPILMPILREHGVRTDEVWRRLGGDGDASFVLEPLKATSVLARAVLDATEDLSRAVISEEQKREQASRPSPVDVIRAAIARDATSGWPARLTARWPNDLFGAHLRGLTLDLDRLPEAIGGSSFARTLELFGRAFRDAKLTSSVPFAMRLEPYGIDSHRLGATFGALVASPVFQRKALDLGETAAKAQTRAFAKTLLFTLRLRAVKALVALRHGAAMHEGHDWDELGERLFGMPLEREWAGAWPRPELDETARFYGSLTAWEYTRELVDRFDEDWFRNPRAFEALRTRLAMPADATLTLGAEKDDASTIAAAVAGAIERLLG